MLTDSEKITIERNDEVMMCVNGYSLTITLDQAHQLHDVLTTYINDNPLPDEKD